MNNINFEDFGNICRVCLLSYDIKSIEDHVILDVYNKLSDIRFETNDGLPQQLCLKCFEKIKEIHAFSVLCKSTNSRLTECLNKHKNITKTDEQDVEIDEKIQEKNELVVVIKKEIVFIPDQEFISPNEEVDLDSKESIIHNEYSENEDCLKVRKNAEETPNTINLNDSETVGENSSVRKLKDCECGVRLHKCDQCAKSFTRASGLKLHKRMHSCERPFKCRHCPKLFSRLNQLKAHVRAHDDECLYDCDRCDEPSPRLDNLKAHNQYGGRSFKCDQCENAFTSASALGGHKQIHSGARPFKCDRCLKAFTSASALIGHKRIHSGVRPFECDFCAKSFTQLSNLKMHLRVHTGERPYKCTLCVKWFSGLSNLKVHQSVHTGERPYTCDQCSKSFALLSTFKRHKLTHSGERPYRCYPRAKSSQLETRKDEDSASSAM